MRPTNDELTRRLCHVLAAHIAAKVTDGGHAEITWTGAPSFNVALPGSAQVLEDAPPTKIDLSKLVADTLPGLWGYMANDPGFERKKMCADCGKVFER